MDDKAVSIQILPNYQLKLSFPNGSEAIVDMSQRIHGIRFGRLVSQALFDTARIEGDEVVWENDQESVHASINELLDSMQMD